MQKLTVSLIAALTALFGFGAVANAAVRRLGVPRGCDSDHREFVRSGDRDSPGMRTGRDPHGHAG